MDQRHSGTIEPGTFPIPLSAVMLEAIRTWAADDRLWGSRASTEFNLCTFARVILKAQGEPDGILQLEEARMVSLEDLRADIIRSAARGQGPTFIAAKLDILIAKATFASVLPEK
jgi:hypothetical protein